MDSGRKVESDEEEMKGGGEKNLCIDGGRGRSNRLVGSWKKDSARCKYLERGRRASENQSMNAWSRDGEKKQKEKTVCKRHEK